MADYSKVLVLLDAGHGASTPGKRSPLFECDGQQVQVREYKWNRDCQEILVKKLKAADIPFYIVTPEEKTDTPLGTRVKRANAKCTDAKKKGIIPFFISIHVNAAGCGQWMNARGWSAWTSKGKTKGDDLANALYSAAHEILDPLKIKVREDWQDGDPDYESNFYVLKYTTCPATLVENFFMDNKEDAKFLYSEEGKEICANILFEGIKKYIAKL